MGPISGPPAQMGYCKDADHILANAIDNTVRKAADQTKACAKFVPPSSTGMNLNGLNHSAHLFDELDTETGRLGIIPRGAFVQFLLGFGVESNGGHEAIS